VSGVKTFGDAGFKIVPVIEDVAEIEPGDGDTESDNAEVDEAATRLANSPPYKENAETGDNGMCNEIRLGACV